MFNKGGGGGGEKHLVAVSSMSDARRPVHIHAHIALCCPHWLSCVEPHAYTHLNVVRPLVRLESSLDLGRSRHGLTGAGEGHEERITLGVNFLAFMAREDLAQDGALIRQQVSVGIAQLR